MQDLNHLISWREMAGTPDFGRGLPKDFAGPLICGVDEAGRGPLAGPVVAAAVILCEGFDTAGIRDSKTLTPLQRQRQRHRLIASPCMWAIGMVEPVVIDEINILQATFLAMRQAIAALGVVPEIVLVDGSHRIPDLVCEQRAIIDGDALEPCIAAASILAKTHRDALMVDYSQRFPDYGFERHKGYGTLEHVTKIYELGPCPIHRRSFHPISTFYPRPDLRGNSNPKSDPQQ